MTKRIIKQKVDCMSNIGDVSKLISHLNMLESRTVSQLTYEIKVMSDGYGAEWVDFTIYEQAEETDEHYENRLRLEKQRQDTQLAREKAEFDRLKVKFGE